MKEEKRSKAGPVAIIGAIASLLVAAGSLWASIAGNSEAELLVESMRNAVAPVAARALENAQDTKRLLERVARLEAVLERMEAPRAIGTAVDELDELPAREPRAIRVDFPRLDDFKTVVQQQGRAWNPEEDAPGGKR